MFKFKSIKTALLTKIGLVAILPLLAITLFNYGYFRNYSTQTTADIQSKVNHITATKVHLFVMVQQLSFGEISRGTVPYNFRSSEEENLKSLTGFLKSMQSIPLYNHLYVTDIRGNVLAYYGKDGVERPFVGKRLVGFRPSMGALNSLYQEHQFVKGEEKASIKGQYSIVPLIETFRTKRLYLMGIADLNILSAFTNEELQVLEKNKISEGTLLLINESNNDIIIETTKQEVYPKGINWMTLDSENREINYEKDVWYGDKEEIIIGGTRYQLVTIATKKDILFHSTKMLRVTIYIVLAALMLMAITILLIAKSFVSPLMRIGDNLKQVAQGDFSGQIEVLSEDEFGQLSVSANKMTQDLDRQAKEIQRHIKQIQLEQEKSEHLLLNILPTTIAERLKQEEKTIADNFPEATVLFSDLVGFTVFSAKHTAEQLVYKLNALYTRFDNLLDKYDIEKIKTIGDALMLVSGAPDPVPNHASEMAKMAFDMYDELDEFNKEHGEELELRIGIHTGPLVAGVIGKYKFCYDLWGDAVNTASRMESHGIPGCVHVSDSTYEKLKDDFFLDCRGTIPVKGKGEMKTYILKKTEDQEWDRDFESKK